MSSNVISLAAGTVLDCTPPETVAVAAAAGYDASGVWVDLATWTPAVAADVRARLADTGLTALDAEVIRLGPDRTLDDAHRLVDVAADVGAPNALTISYHPDRGRTVAEYAELCAHGESVGVRPVLEFMRFTQIRSLDDALDVVTQAGQLSGAILVDAIHLSRSGGTPADVAAVDARLLPYAQLCDAIGTIPPDDGLVEEALDGRLLPGEGVLPLTELIDALPTGTPYSVELRSKALRDGYSDPVERARVVLAATRSVLDGTPSADPAPR